MLISLKYVSFFILLAQFSHTFAMNNDEYDDYGSKQPYSHKTGPSPSLIEKDGEKEKEKEKEEDRAVDHSPYTLSTLRRSKLIPNRRSHGLDSWDPSSAIQAWGEAPYTKIGREDIHAHISLGFSSDFAHQTDTINIYKYLHKLDSKIKRLKVEINKSKTSTPRSSAKEISNSIRLQKQKIESINKLISLQKEYIEKNPNLKDKDAAQIADIIRQEINFLNENIASIKDEDPRGAEELKISVKEEEIYLNAFKKSEHEYTKDINFISTKIIPSFKKNLNNVNKEEDSKQNELDKLLESLDQAICVKSFTVYDLPFKGGWLSTENTYNILAPLFDDPERIKPNFLDHYTIKNLFTIHLEFPDMELSYESDKVDPSVVYQEQLKNIRNLLEMRLQEDVFTFECIAILIPKNHTTPDDWKNDLILEEFLVERALTFYEKSYLDPSRYLEKDITKFKNILVDYGYCSPMPPKNPNFLHIDEISKMIFQTVQGGLLGRILKAMNEEHAFSWQDANTFNLMNAVRNKLRQDLNSDVFPELLMITHRILKRYINLLVIQNLII